MIKTTLFRQAQFCWTLESLQLLDWAINRFKLYLKWQLWQFGTIDKPGTSLFQQYTIQSACYTYPILLVSTILHFLTPNFKATVRLLWKFTKWLKTCWKNVVCTFVEFLHVVLKLFPTKSGCHFFWTSQYIYGFRYRYNAMGLLYFRGIFNHSLSVTSCYR